MDSYPAGLYARPQCFRVLKSVWTNECQLFVISRMKAAAGNIKPVIVIDDNTKKSKCYLVNENIDDFDEITGLDAAALCRQVDETAEWQIEKTKIQNSNKSKASKEQICELLEKKHLFKQKLSNQEKQLLTS